MRFQWIARARRHWTRSEISAGFCGGERPRVRPFATIRSSIQRGECRRAPRGAVLDTEMPERWLPSGDCPNHHGSVPHLFLTAVGDDLYTVVRSPCESGLGAKIESATIDGRRAAGPPAPTALQEGAAGKSVRRSPGRGPPRGGSIRVEWQNYRSQARRRAGEGTFCVSGEGFAGHPRNDLLKGQLLGLGPAF